MARVRIGLSAEAFAPHPAPTALAVDRLPAGSSRWEQVGLFAVRGREIEVEVGPGDRLRCAGAEPAEAPYGAPAGLTAVHLSDWVEVPLP